MKVIVAEPKKEPYVKEIDGSLESMQEIVGGYITYYFPWGNRVVVVCDEDGELKSLPRNRFVGHELVLGTFFMCSLEYGEFVGLTDEEIERYMKIINSLAYAE